MKIAGVASAFPPHRYTQQEITAALKRHWADKLENVQVLERLHSHVGVEFRHLALPIDEYDSLTTWGQFNRAWIRVAGELAEVSLCKAMDRAGVSAAALGALFFVSVTGVCSPSLDARLINRMHLPSGIKRIPIFGLGCVAGAAAIARAADYVRAFPDQCAALIAVELCSLTWQREDLSAANLISSGLFGDGAAAVIVAGRDLIRMRKHNGALGDGPEILATRSVFYPGTEYVMGWDISEKGFQIVLSPDVPQMVRIHLREDVDRFLAGHQLRRTDITTWIMHTGGPKVLQATAESLELPQGALDVSWRSLAEAGNLSSASVLVVLEQVMERNRPAAGTYSVLAAMGPGFCSELVLLRW
jgi:alkylresorcinol/alkylpyrone synthase